MRPLALLGLASISVTLGCDGRAVLAQDAGERTRGPDAGLCIGPPTPTQPLRCFQACSDDSECVEVWPIGSCTCVPWIVNRRFEELVREKARLEAPRGPDGGPYVGCGCWACVQGVPGCVASVCAQRPSRWRCTRFVPDGSP